MILISSWLRVHPLLPCRWTFGLTPVSYIREAFASFRNGSRPRVMKRPLRVGSGGKNIVIHVFVEILFFFFFSRHVTSSNISLLIFLLLVCFLLFFLSLCHLASSAAFCFSAFVLLLTHAVEQPPYYQI